MKDLLLVGFLFVTQVAGLTAFCLEQVACLRRMGVVAEDASARLQSGVHVGLV